MGKLNEHDKGAIFMLESIVEACEHKKMDSIPIQYIKRMIADMISEDGWTHLGK